VLDAAPESTLHDVLLARVGDRHLDVGTRLRLEGVDLVVRAMYEGLVEQVGLVIHDDVIQGTPEASSSRELDPDE
jgi:hypothetical protein